MKQLAYLTILLAAAAALAAGSISTHQHSSVAGVPHSAFFVGRTDTVGTTTYDWQGTAPPEQTLFHDPRFGTHIAWMWSDEPGPPWSERSARYAFRGLNDTCWRSCRPLSNRSGYGTLDVDPRTGCACISSHLGQSDHQYPAVARDLGPGIAMFETDSGPPDIVNFLWPRIMTGASGRIHMAMIDYPARTALYYTHITWPGWLSPPILISEPGFPSHSIAASHQTGRVCITWQYANEHSGGWFPYRALYRQSWNDGVTWEAVETLPAPPTFHPVPGETLGPTFHISSLHPFFDSHDNLHIAASVACARSESAMYITPVELWHWREAVGWNRIHRADADSIPRGSIGYNTLFACRATLAEGEEGKLFCTWEQFDPLNCEPLTDRLRADIWAAGSTDNGVTWGPAVRLTDPDETSKRYPTLSPQLTGDTCLVGYMIDSVAGFVVQSEGPCTVNPIVVHYVPKSAMLPSATSEFPAIRPHRLSLSITPNPFHGRTEISFSPAPAVLEISDACGRVVERLRPTTSQTVLWDARHQPSGIYFCRLRAGNHTLTRKLTLLP